MGRRADTCGPRWCVVRRRASGGRHNPPAAARCARLSGWRGGSRGGRKVPQVSGRQSGEADAQEGARGRLSRLRPILLRRGVRGLGISGRFGSASGGGAAPDRRARAVAPVDRSGAAEPAIGVRDFGARLCMCMLHPLVGAAICCPPRRWRWRGEAAGS